MDDIGVAANNGTELIRSIRVVIKCFRLAGLNLTIEKCHFEVRQNEFFIKTSSPEGISPQVRQVHTFLDKLSFPISQNALQQYLG